MGIEIAIAVGALAIGGAGLAMNYSGQQSAKAAQEKSLQLQQQEDQQRQQAMNLDSTRRKREMIRQSIAARSQALSAATNQGAAQGSGLPGGYGGISGRTGVNELGVNQNEEIGNNIFGLKRGITSANMDLAEAQSTSALGAGMTSLGGAALNNIGQITRIGNSAASWFHPVVSEAISP